MVANLMVFIKGMLGEGRRYVRNVLFWTQRLACGCLASLLLDVLFVSPLGAFSGSAAKKWGKKVICDQSTAGRLHGRERRDAV